MSDVTRATCAAVSAAICEPTAGSASAISSWVLIEHDGPWGEDSREEIFAEVLGEQRWALLEKLWVERQLRPLLIRRPAGHPESRRGRRVGNRRDRPAARVLVGSALGDGFLELTDVPGLLAMDLIALADGRPGHGEALHAPAFLVCTNGAVDRCCALDGRRLVDVLGVEHPDLVWECTHLGGCRFAANLLALPSGQMHGRLTPEAALGVVRAAVGDSVAVIGWRGRTTESSWCALATEQLRVLLDLASPADLRVVEERLHDDNVEGEDDAESAGCDVAMADKEQRWRVVLRADLLGPRVSACDPDGGLFPTPVVTSAAPAS